MQVEGQHRSSNTLVATGARVSNAYATYLSEGDNPAKVGLIPHKTGAPHGDICYRNSLIDGHAFHQVVGEVTAHQADDP